MGVQIMRKLIIAFKMILIGGLLGTSCDSVVDNNANDDLSLNSKKKFNPTAAVQSTSSVEECQDTGIEGLTAHYINEIPQNPLTVSCDVGIFFDEPGAIDKATLHGTSEKARSKQYGIYVHGANVNVTSSQINVDEDYPNKFVPITYHDGATGDIRNNKLHGAHRSGIVIRGEGTDVRITKNTIEGTGAKTVGWAENGIQIDQDATADIRNNTVKGHWWDGESNWASTGIMLWGSNNSNVVNNKLADNEFSIYLGGNDNSAKGNRIRADIISESSLEFSAWGILVAGSNNDVSGNGLSATNGGAGIYVVSDVTGNKLTGNRIRGFQWPVINDGDDTMARGNPSFLN